MFFVFYVWICMELSRLILALECVIESMGRVDVRVALPGYLLFCAGRAARDWALGNNEMDGTCTCIY